MVAAMLAVPALADPQARQMLIEVVFEALGRPISLRDQPTPRLQLLELFRCCAAFEDGISTLMRGVQEVDRGSVQVDEVLRTGDEWNALQAMPDLKRSWRLLSISLRECAMPLSARIAAIEEATDRQLVGPPGHSDTPWSDFCHLCDRNAGPDHLPPWMLYLERAVMWTQPPRRHELRARNRNLALDWGIAPQLDRLRWYAPDRQPFAIGRYDEYLAIQISPDLLASERYKVSHVFRSDAKGPDWLPGDPRQGLARDELEQAVSEVVSQVEAANGDRRAHLRLEFVLPLDLLNLPVDWWPRDSSEVPNVPLALDYPVVVRSLERLQHVDWHRRWRNRWEQMKQSEPWGSSVFMSTGHQQVALGDFDAKLSDEHCVALVLSEPPDSGREHGHREVFAALRSGLPVVIWHRTASTTRQYRRALETLLEQGLQGLPDRLVELRRQAAACTPEDQIQHIGRHLTVLWDDPDRKPTLAS